MQSYRVGLTRISHNKKTGRIPVSTTEARTCPPTCEQYDTCYAKFGPLLMHWNKINSGERGMDWPDFCDEISRLPRKQLWRHNQAGDLPGDGVLIDQPALEELVQANKGRRGFTYTHYKVLVEDREDYFYMNLTEPRLKEVLHYDPETGDFTWLKQTGSRTKVGEVAGSVKKNGYRYISVDGTSYLAHRLAWLYTTERMPSDLIDHVDMNPLNNKRANLREATKSQNAQNQCKAQAHNKSSKYLGVSYSKRDRKWIAVINLEGERFFLGGFLTEEYARDAYLAAKLKHHPFAEAAVHNIRAMEAANEAGFTVNVSCDSLTASDAVAQITSLPQAVVLPSGTTEHSLYTAGGRKVVVCPATYRDDMDCARCGICADNSPDRAVIGFPAHGTKKRVIDLKLMKEQ